MVIPTGRCLDRRARRDCHGALGEPERLL